MGFFKRLFSADYRTAVAAEAAGDLDLAAERYALAGQVEAAVRIHLSRADRADRRADEIAALRDALHWAPEDGKLRALVSRRLGRALLARAEAEGVATERDRERIREAASLLEGAGDFSRAGDALSSIGDTRAAAAAYRRGGLVDKLETALGEGEERFERGRVAREALSDYALHLEGGSRDDALTAIRRALDHSDDKAEIRRQLADLESRLITSGRVTLRIRNKGELVLCSGDVAALGRDALCDLVLRSGGVSRRHAEIGLSSGAFELRDAGSRNGTRIGGLPIAAAVPLDGTGRFSLGDECEVEYRHDSGVLFLDIRSGLDAGKRLAMAPEGIEIPVAEPSMSIRFRDGRPILRRGEIGQRVMLGSVSLAHGDIQLIHGDQLSIAGLEVEVA